MSGWEGENEELLKGLMQRQIVATLLQPSLSIVRRRPTPSPHHHHHHQDEEWITFNASQADPFAESRHLKVSIEPTERVNGRALASIQGRHAQNCTTVLTLAH